nr:hypothetical protein [Tanacetum cinerariifolium]
MFIEDDTQCVRKGAALIMTNFSVTENIDTYKLINNPFKIVLHRKTYVEAVDKFIGSLNGFRFVQFDDILDKNITDNQCVDLIGELVGILRPIQHESMTILLKDLEGSRIQCRLSTEYKHELISLIGTDMHCPKILIIQFGTVFKIDGIELFIS